ITKAANVPMLGIRQNVLTAEVVAQVRAAGLGIGGWACNDAEAIARLLALEVDVFTTDRPDLALGARHGRGVSVDRELPARS
ncbi:MAG TPA: glycerophosphodiester phosphodiesterase family protein, partial [Reyranella sp.]